MLASTIPLTMASTPMSRWVRSSTSVDSASWTATASASSPSTTSSTVATSSIGRNRVGDLPSPLLAKRALLDLPRPLLARRGSTSLPVSLSPQGRGKTRRRRSRDSSCVLVSRDDAMFF